MPLAVYLAEVQEKRQLADYDLTEYFVRSDVLALIEQAKDHIVQFRELDASKDKKFFLACLWAWKELVNR